jgi:hypothetical protein
VTGCCCLLAEKAKARFGCCVCFGSIDRCSMQALSGSGASVWLGPKNVMNRRVGSKHLGVSCEGYPRCGRLGPLWWSVIRVAFSSNPRVVPLRSSEHAPFAPLRALPFLGVQGCTGVHPWSCPLWLPLEMTIWADFYANAGHFNIKYGHPTRGVQPWPFQPTSLPQSRVVLVDYFTLGVQP